MDPLWICPNIQQAQPLLLPNSSRRGILVQSASINILLHVPKSCSPSGLVSTARQGCRSLLQAISIHSISQETAMATYCQRRQQQSLASHLSSAMARDGSKPPVKAKATLRGGSKLRKKTCWTCWMPKCWPSSCQAALLLQKMMRASIIKDEESASLSLIRTARAAQYLLPVHILNEEGLAKQKALSAIAGE